MNYKNFSDTIHEGMIGLLGFTVGVYLASLILQIFPDLITFRALWLKLFIAVLYGLVYILSVLIATAIIGKFFDCFSEKTNNHKGGNNERI